MMTAMMYSNRGTLMRGVFFGSRKKKDIKDCLSGWLSYLFHAAALPLVGSVLPEVVSIR